VRGSCVGQSQEKELSSNVMSQDLESKEQTLD